MTVPRIFRMLVSFDRHLAFLIFAGGFAKNEHVFLFTNKYNN